MPRHPGLAEAAKAAARHDRDRISESVGLLHRVSREHYRPPTLRTLDQKVNVSLDCSKRPSSDHCAWGLVSRSGWSLVNETGGYLEEGAFGAGLLRGQPVLNTK